MRIFLLLLFLNVTPCKAQNTDIDLLRKINLERNQNLDGFYKVITNSDTPISLGIPTIILTVGLIKKDSLSKQNALMMGSSLFVSTLIMTTMKYTIKRDRPFITYPELEKLAPAGSPSFPSGHTSMAFSTATSLSFAYPKWYVIAPSFIWASAVGYSRMHLGVHYPSDVLIGAFIGSGSAWLCSYFTKKIQLKRRQSKGEINDNLSSFF